MWSDSSLGSWASQVWVIYPPLLHNYLTGCDLHQALHHLWALVSNTEDGNRTVNRAAVRTEFRDSRKAEK